MLYKTKFGNIYICANNDGITAITFQKTENDSEENYLTKKAFEELEEYFSGRRKYFDVPLNLDGTDFQKKVWNKLLKIPYGSTISYGELAKLCGNKNASRAVGNANNKNKIMIMIPCHRVIGSNGKLTGYAGGLNIKKQLLALENKNK